MVYLAEYVGRKKDRRERHGKPVKLLKGQRRERILEAVVENLRQFRSSAFEREGACRAALRSALCLVGQKWVYADKEAESIVAQGLRILGAERPSWEQGQPEYLDPMDVCCWCKKPLPDDIVPSVVSRRFCSEGCARSALRYRDFRRRDTEDSAYAAVYESIRIIRNPPVECSHCKRNFRPKVDSQKYCSNACKRAARIMVEEKVCLQCGEMFKPHSRYQNNNEKGKFCSMACKGAYQSAQTFARTCAVCDTQFISRSKAALYCSSSCTNKAHRMRHAAESGWRGADATYTGRCEQCGSFFESKSKVAKYCGRLCYTAAMNERRRPKRRKSNVIPFPLLTPQIFDGWFGQAA